MTNGWKRPWIGALCCAAALLVGVIFLHTWRAAEPEASQASGIESALHAVEKATSALTHAPSPSPAKTQTPSPTLPPMPTPTPAPTPPYEPDWAWLGDEANEYHLNIHWEAVQFDADRPLELLKIMEIPEDEREPMLSIMRQWASLYPPEHFNRYIGDILCYRSLAVPVLDENDALVYGADGALRYETIYGATSRGTIIITDRFDNERDILRALVHEMTHLEWNKSYAPQQKIALESAFREINGDFAYWYEREGIASTSDIDGWRSSEGKTDWQEGWARRYGSLSFDEDLATVTEKIVMGSMGDFSQYDRLMKKMRAVVAWRTALHPDQNEDFYLRVLPEFLRR